MNDDRLTTRDIWLKKRIRQCVDELAYPGNNLEWAEYKRQIKNIAEEMLYAVTEWDKYYD